MKINKAVFVTSSSKYTQCPTTGMPEFAFIGRSNVGKSSLINFLCNQNSLCKTSSTPGKTQSINHFMVNETWYLVDLPGYGYAKVSKDKRETFKNFSNEYILKRETLYNVFVLIDSSIPPQMIDVEFVYWLGKNNIAFSLIFTKSDKAKQVDVEKNIEGFKYYMKENWAEFPPMFITSVKKKRGSEELLFYIEQILVGK